ncbi:hypothetical protein CHU98_g3496 [Xylaria longipes]|nr:hypothetical protein CHU98_g3496 [Xylaria longipes]
MPQWECDEGFREDVANGIVQRVLSRTSREEVHPRAHTKCTAEGLPVSCRGLEFSRIFSRANQWVLESNCVEAKARCDLKRPACSRCDVRSIPCVYPRLARTAATDTGPVPKAHSGLASECSLVDPRLDLDAGAVTIADADADVGTYLDCESDFTGLSGCLVPELFHPDSTDVSDATPSSGSGFHAVYSTSCSTVGTHTPPCNSNSHHSVSPFGAGSLDVQLDLDSSPGIDADLPVVLREDFGYGTRLLLDDVDSFSATGTTATTDPKEIDPWILALAAKPIVPDPPALLEHSVQTLFRNFRSWPRMLAKGIQLPPMIHFFQFCCDGKRDIGGGGDAGMPKHISRCVTLCKMWVGQAEDSAQIVQCAVRGEVESILAKYRTYDAPTLLAALQSLLILLILLFFPSNRQGTMSVVPGHVFAAVQEMVNHVLSTGMLLHEEASHVCPPWRIWAHIEAKRRTLVSIYFLHWAYSVYHGARHFNCLQLGRMLAPGPKWLWLARDEKTWVNLYGRWLAQWDGKELIHAEFFLVEKGLAMDSRIEMWLEDTDELGILILSIMNAAQRDLTKIRDAESHILG